MNAEVYEVLCDRARQGKTITYSELAPFAGLDMKVPAHRRKIANILHEISTSEHREDRPILSSIVVYKTRGRKLNPGPGYFTMLRQILLCGDGREEERVAFDRELKRVFQHWQP